MVSFPLNDELQLEVTATSNIISRVSRVRRAFDSQALGSFVALAAESEWQPLSPHGAAKKFPKASFRNEFANRGP